MTKLSDFLSEHLKAQGIDQKQAAVAFLAKIDTEALELSTITTKLSKLFGGYEEGEKFFFGKPERIGALAAALDLQPERLVALRDAWVVIPHPRLPEEVLAYLARRSETEDAKFTVEHVLLSDDVRTALRDLARKSSRRIVVLPDDRDVAFFVGADVQTSLLEMHPRGWILVAQPELVPLPPPPSPAMWAGDASPLFPCDELASQVTADWKRRASEHVYGTRRRERHDDVLERGGEPRFGFEDLAGAHKRELLDAKVQLHFDRYNSWSNAIFATVLGHDATTHIWSRGRRVFGIGPNVARAREILGGDACPHELERPASLDAWVDAFRGWNPWATLPSPPSSSGLAVERTEGDVSRWRQMHDEVMCECGLDVDQGCDRWWSETLGVHSKGRTPVAANVRDEVRVALRELSERDVEARPGNESVAFRLQAVASAPLVELGAVGRERFRVLANLGAGHLLEVRCFAYPEEMRTPLRGDVNMLVGGDVTLLMSTHRDVLLEASGLASARRREREEASRRYDDDD